MYDYQKEKLRLEKNPEYYFRIKKEALNLIRSNGMFLAHEVMDGDSWLCLAAFDKLIEEGVLRRLPSPPGTFAQNERYGPGQKIQLWRIWSFEHQSWWRANSNGYTEDIKEAGLYQFDEALEIVQNANRYATGSKPEEAMCPATN